MCNSTNICLMCDGVGCSLRDRCQLYADGENVDRNAPGTTWVSCCPDDEFVNFVPSAK